VPHDASASDVAATLDSIPGARVVWRGEDWESVLVWERQLEGKWEAFYDTSKLLARPKASLQDLNEDGTIDLWWSFSYEDLIGGEVVLDVGDSPVEVDLSFDQCHEPALEQAAKGFRLHALASTGMTGARCVAMDVASLCHAGHSDSWPRFFRVADSHLIEEPGTAYDYDVAREAYRAAAERLDSLYAVGAEVGYQTTYEQICGSTLPAQLRALADSAALLRL